MTDSIDRMLKEPDDDWIEQYIMTVEQAETIANPKWIVENLVIQGHFIVIPAEPNGGKTTIFWHLAKRMVCDKHMVAYVNADISGVDA